MVPVHERFLKISKKIKFLQLLRCTVAKDKGPVHSGVESVKLALGGIAHLAHCFVTPS